MKVQISYHKVRNTLERKEFHFMKAVVTSKGQVTIPVFIRTKAHITPGTKLDFQIEADGTLKVSLLNQEFSRLKGIIKSKKHKPVSLQEMKNAIRKVSKKHAL